MASQTGQGDQTLGKLSLGLGLFSAIFVFGIGLCALTGTQGGWLGALAVPLFVCGGTSAFIGVLGALTGLGGLLRPGAGRRLALVGIGLSLIGVCLFLAVLGGLSG